MSTIRVGSSKQYADGWENVFGCKKKPAKKAPAKRATAKKAVKKPTKKRAKK